MRGRALGAGKLWRRQNAGGSSSWVFDYRTADGRRQRKVLGSDKRVAEQARAQLLAERDRQLAGLGHLDAQDRTLGELREAYLGDLATRACERHVESVRDRLDRILKAVRVVRVRDLQPFQVLAFRGSLVRAGRSNRTCNLATDALRGMLRWSVRAGLIAHDPLASLPRLPENEANRRYHRRALSEEEIGRFLSAADQEDHYQSDRLAAVLTISKGTQGRPYAAIPRPTRVPQAPLFEFLVTCGSRYGETIALTWADFDAGDRVVTLRAATTKAKKSRQIPVRGELAEKLVALRPIHERVLRRPLRPGDPVFRSADGKPWGAPTTNIARILDRVLNRAGLERETPEGKVDVHGLRHCAATRFARAGVPIVQTARILGHSSIELTNRVYTHVGVEDLRDAVEAIPSPSRVPALRALKDDPPPVLRDHGASA